MQKNSSLMVRLDEESKALLAAAFELETAEDAIASGAINV